MKLKDFGPWRPLRSASVESYWFKAGFSLNISGNLYLVQWRIQGGAPPARTPLPRTKIFFISCSFWENPANLYVGAPPRGWRPLLRGILYPPLLCVFLIFFSSCVRKLCKNLENIGSGRGLSEGMVGVYQISGGSRIFQMGGRCFVANGGAHILFSGKKCMKLKEIGLKWGGARLLAPCYSKITIFLWIILNSIMKTSYFTYLRIFWDILYKIIF